MTWRRTVLLTVCLSSLVFVLTFYTLQARDRLDPVDLEARIRSSRPQWANYQEDIKGQIGAAPVAQWNGHPLSATLRGQELLVRFELEGAWIERLVALPILVRDPFGGMVLNHGAHFESPEVEYQFLLSNRQGDMSVPWVELKYPHRETRLVFSPEGTWNANEGMR